MRTTLKTIAIAGACALAGTGAGIAGSDAHSGGHFRNHDGHRLGRFAKGPVHADLVVPTRGGEFKTVTLDRGLVESVGAGSLTIKEGTPTATYKTVTLTIPSGAKIRRNGDDAQLSDLQEGDYVIVVQAAGKTFVRAIALTAGESKED